MKAFLMHRDRDFDSAYELSPNDENLIEDLGLNALFGAMALEDGFLFDVARAALMSSLPAPSEIAYRQAVLGDCLEHQSITRELYDIAARAIASPKKVFWGFMSQHPSSVLHGSVAALPLLLGALKQLRQVADEHSDKFRSEGFATFFAMILSELDDAYLRAAEEHVQTLRFRRGVLISAELGEGAQGKNYVLRRPHETKRGLVQRISSLASRSSYVYEVPPRDQSGARALGKLRDRGINSVANAAAQSSDHILDFFRMLRVELGFYVGCLNLRAYLEEKGEPTCFPVPLASGGHALTSKGLYDVCLALLIDQRVVGNDVTADDKALVMVTGANQGGKSTFLRSIGLAQMMMQCGMFVAADQFRADVRDGVFTHFKREEDAAMESGKLDEELARMSGIANALAPNSLVLFNESFAATNEREGSEIARQITRALLDAGIKIVFVTHLYDLAHGFYAEGTETALFLRAERQTGGRRTFRLVEGEPLQTSFGEDVYRRVFGTWDAAKMTPEAVDG